MGFGGGLRGSEPEEVDQRLAGRALFISLVRASILPVFSLMMRSLPSMVWRRSWRTRFWAAVASS